VIKRFLLLLLACKKIIFLNKYNIHYSTVISNIDVYTAFQYSIRSVPSTLRATVRCALQYSIRLGCYVFGCMLYY
jgi:hypothetical protein